MKTKEPTHCNVGWMLFIWGDKRDYTLCLGHGGWRMRYSLHESLGKRLKQEIKVGDLQSADRSDLIIATL